MGIAAVSGAVLVGLVPTAASAANQSRGALLDVVPVAEFQADQVANYLTNYGLDTSRVRFGVDTKRIVYRTIDPRGRSTTASALVVLPRNGDRTPRQVTWLHGTTGYRGSTASLRDGNDRAFAVFFASAGYLTTAPDYLGLGAGPGTHPYMHAPSEVTASVDALRAARELAGRTGRRPDSRVLVTGHSQGGHVTMALGAALQRGADPRLALAGLAPISGPMHMSRSVAHALAGQIDHSVAYMAYLTVAWNRLYHLYDSPSDAFNKPSIEELFDGDHRDEEIFPELPPTVTDLYKTSFKTRLENPRGALRAALIEADSFCDWRPRVPVRIYTSSGDREVPIFNSTYCQQRLDRRGAQAELIDLGADVGHMDAPNHALPRILAEFDRR
jgi:alpha-beta hydrolase superfamily lysophospholipase